MVILNLQEVFSFWLPTHSSTFLSLSAWTSVVPDHSPNHSRTAFPPAMNHSVCVSAPNSKHQITTPFLQPLSHARQLTVFHWWFNGSYFCNHTDNSNYIGSGFSYNCSQGYANTTKSKTDTPNVHACTSTPSCFHSHSTQIFQMALTYKVILVDRFTKLRSAPSVM